MVFESLGFRGLFKLKTRLCLDKLQIDLKSHGMILKNRLIVGFFDWLHVFEPESQASFILLDLV